MKDIVQAEFRYNEEQQIYKVTVEFVDGEKAVYTTTYEIIAVSAKLKEQQLQQQQK